MGSKAKWRRQRNVSANLKIEKQKLPNLDNREKIDGRKKKKEHSQRELQDYNKYVTFMSEKEWDQNK